MTNRNELLKKCFVPAVVALLLSLLPVGAGNVFAKGAAPDQSSNVVHSTIKETVLITSSGPISTGARGEAVKNVQVALNNNGYNINVDGIFGPETEQAVREFQQNHQLEANGVVGPETKAALQSSTVPVNNEESTKQEVVKEQTTVENNQVPATTNVDIVSIAKSLVGSPYRFGGTTPDGFDSSGFINYVFSQVGIQLDRTHAGMWANNGRHVDCPNVGDVVFFANTYKPGVSHSGIYIGNNQMIHAGTEKTGVEIVSLDNSYWRDRYIGAKSFR